MKDELNFGSTDAAPREFSAELVRQDFPILHQSIHRQRELIYFDNAASSQHPVSVIEAMDDCYRNTYANVHRGVHFLSERVSAQFEEARQKVQYFINAPCSQEVIFTSGTTASINLVARSWGEANLKPGDEILLTIFEHHSNIVPWQQVAQRTGAKIKFVPVEPDGNFELAELERCLNVQTKVVAIAAVSNVLGLRVPVIEVVKRAQAVGAMTLVDAAQHVPHEATDVQAWGADFVVFSAHKMLGPSGIGVLWGRQSMLEAMPPFLGGGGMIETVTTAGFRPGDLPCKFEAGTPPVVEAIGLGAAIDYLNRFSLDDLAGHGVALAAEALKHMSAISGITILGPPTRHRTGIVSFTIDGVSAQDLAILLDRKGIAIRAGHHCTMPLHDHLGIRASCRASFYLYNTLEEVHRFVRELELAVHRLRGDAVR
jgi:cysteine desulfurase/selenocysteine lyase